MQDVCQQGGLGALRGGPQLLLQFLKHSESGAEAQQPNGRTPHPPAQLTAQGMPRSCRAARKRRWKSSPSSGPGPAIRPRPACNNNVYVASRDSVEFGTFVMVKLGKC